MRIIARHYPNSELRVVICPDRPMRVCQEQEAGSLEERAVAAVGEPLVITSELKTACQGQNRAGSPACLPPGYGGHPRPTAFGNNGRRTILRCAGALEKIGARPQEVAFLTGTLPGSTARAMRALQDWASYAVNLLKAKISKLGIHDSYSFYVWELQERGALHLHYAIHVPEDMDMERLINGFKKIWIQIIDAICVRSGVDLWEREWGGSWAERKDVIRADAQRCKKSPGSYMAKYVSKDSFAPKFIRDKNAEFLGPVRWWGCSRPLMGLMKFMTKTIEKTAISWYRIKHIREDLLSILDGLNARIIRYTDKAKSAEVFVSYDKQNGMAIFNSIARLLTGPLLGVGWQEGGNEVGDSQGDHTVQVGTSSATATSVAIVNAEIFRECINSGGSKGACPIGGNGASGVSHQMAVW